jgi:hypothetical protein
MTKLHSKGKATGHENGKDVLEPVQPDSHEQSGSAGRPTGDGKSDAGKDTGQDRYGQTGLGGSRSAETDGQARYRSSGAGVDAEAKSRSNPGSGRAEHEAEEYRGDDAARQLARKAKLQTEKPRR